MTERCIFCRTQPAAVDGRCVGCSSAAEVTTQPAVRRDAPTAREVGLSIDEILYLIEGGQVQIALKKHELTHGREESERMRSRFISSCLKAGR